MPLLRLSFPARAKIGGEGLKDSADTPPPRSPESADYFGSGEPSSRPTSLPTPGTSWPHNSTPTPHRHGP